MRRGPFDMPQRYAVTAPIFRTFVSPLLIFLCSATLFLICPCGHAALLEKERGKNQALESYGIVQYKFDDDFKIRGWRLTPHLYFGQAKIASQWGIGFMVERPRYAYGINNERLSIVVRF
jgi:hypothetical protein